MTNEIRLYKNWYSVVQSYKLGSTNIYNINYNGMYESIRKPIQAQLTKSGVAARNPHSPSSPVLHVLLSSLWPLPSLPPSDRHSPPHPWILNPLSQKAQPCRDKRPQLFFLRCPRCSKSKFLLAPSCRRHLQPLLSLKSPSVPISSASERNKLLLLDPPNARTNIFNSANMVPETRNTPSNNMAFTDFPPPLPQLGP